MAQGQTYAHAHRGGNIEHQHPGEGLGDQARCVLALSVVPSYTHPEDAHRLPPGPVVEA